MAIDDIDIAGIDELRRRLREAEETLSAIRHGEVDALLIAHETADRVYTLRSADAPYRALIEQMQEGAVTLAPDGSIIYCNRSFAQMVGMPLEKVIGSPIDLIIDSRDSGLLIGPWVEGGETFRTTLGRDRGKPIDAHVSVSSVTLGDEAHRTLIVTDISTLTRVQRESRSKDEFLAMLSHELRNPLGAIAAAAQILQLSRLDDAQAERAREIIERQVGQMARLVDDLLEMGRVVTGKIALNRRPVDLADIVRESVAANMAGAAGGRVIDVDAQAAWVSGDPVRLEQIVGNLISNAVKFTTPPQRIMVSLHADGGEAVLRVHDEGVGIEAPLLPHVFDLFVQGEESKARAAKGLGIGLTLVRRLVELHGGTVTAASPGRDRGSVFTVRLPSSAAAELPAPGPIVVAARPSRRVLLVDDNADAREMCSMALTADGHEVRTAADGDEALEVIRNWSPDVAVVDIGLPTMDGHELARRLRERLNGHRVTLIALTGYGFPEDRARSRAAGFDRHLVKPLSPTSLRQVIDAAADQAVTDRE